MILQTEKERRKENVIQITKEHRDEFPADTISGGWFSVFVHGGNGFRSCQVIPVRRSATAKSVYFGSGQIVMGGALARRTAEPTG